MSFDFWTSVELFFVLVFVAGLASMLGITISFERIECEWPDPYLATSIVIP